MRERVAFIVTIQYQLLIFIVCIVVFCLLEINKKIIKKIKRNIIDRSHYVHVAMV